MFFCVLGFLIGCLGFGSWAIEAEVNFSFWFGVLGSGLKVTMGVNKRYLSEGSESM